MSPYELNNGLLLIGFRRSVHTRERKCREISNPEADLQLIAPPANRELFKSRFAKAREMNASNQRRQNAERASANDAFWRPSAFAC